MKIAVITPYFKEPLEVLRQCFESVLAQELRADHFFIADGHPRPELDQWGVKHVVLPQSHANNGNTPRGIGGLLARAEGYDFVAYLDADNWYQVNHLSSLVRLWQSSRSPVCCALRTFHRLDGQFMPIREVDEESHQHVDTSCFLIQREAFDCLDIWLKMPNQLAAICDRIFYKALENKKIPIAFSDMRTVAFRTQYASHYLSVNLTPPAHAKSGEDRPCVKWLESIEGINESVRMLGFYPTFLTK